MEISVSAWDGKEEGNNEKQVIVIEIQQDRIQQDRLLVRFYEFEIESV